MNSKAQLRQNGLRARAALGESGRAEKSSTMQRLLAGWDVYRKARHVCLYASFGTEAQTWPLLERFYSEAPPQADPHQEDRGSGAVSAVRSLYLPRVQGDSLALHRVSPPVSDGSAGMLAALVRSPMGMPEPCADMPVAAPQQMDLILVPGSAFSKSGDRLGYGKGFYDRLLAAAPQAVKVGFCFEAQVFPAAGFAVEPHDVPLDFLLTEAGFCALCRR